jgi:hypothetical protein
VIGVHNVTYYLVPFVFGMVLRFCCDSSDGQQHRWHAPNRNGDKKRDSSFVATECNKNKNVFLDVVSGLYQGDLYFQNAVRLHVIRELRGVAPVREVRPSAR